MALFGRVQYLFTELLPHRAWLYDYMVELKDANKNAELNVIHRRFHARRGSMPFTGWSQKLCLRCLLPQFNKVEEISKVGRFMECVYCTLTEDPDPLRREIGEKLFEFSKAMERAFGTKSAIDAVYKEDHKLMEEGWYAVLRFAESRNLMCVVRVFCNFTQYILRLEKPFSILHVGHSGTPDGD